MEICESPIKNISEAHSTSGFLCLDKFQTDYQLVSKPLWLSTQVSVCVRVCVYVWVRETQTYFIQTSSEIYHNLARSVVINNLKFPNVTCNNHAIKRFE